MPRPIKVLITPKDGKPFGMTIYLGRRSFLEIDALFEIALEMAMGTKDKDSTPDFQISITAAPLLDPVTQLNIFNVTELPSPCRQIFAKLLYLAANSITAIWQVALIPDRWFQTHGFLNEEIEDLNLFLANYGLHTDMTREELPPGEDKPWNVKPYWEPPKHVNEPTQQYIGFFIGEEDPALGKIRLEIRQATSTDLKSK